MRDGRRKSGRLGEPIRTCSGFARPARTWRQRGLRRTYRSPGASSSRRRSPCLGWRGSREASAQVTLTKGALMGSITPCLWFDTEGEEAAELYTSVFPNSRILDVSRYGDGRPEAGGHGDDRRLHARRPGVRRAQRRPGVHVQRGDLVLGRLQRRRTRSTATGRSSPRAASTARAAGSRTASASPGRSSRAG